jgi:hypothetical protein
MGELTLKTSIDEKQLLDLLGQLPPEEKIRIADLLRAQAAKVHLKKNSKHKGDEEIPLTAKDLHALYAENPSFDFLAAEEEDIYADADLKVKY